MEHIRNVLDTSYNDLDLIDSLNEFKSQLSLFKDSKIGRDDLVNIDFQEIRNELLKKNKYIHDMSLSLNTKQNIITKNEDTILKLDEKIKILETNNSLICLKYQNKCNEIKNELIHFEDISKKINLKLSVLYQKNIEYKEKILYLSQESNYRHKEENKLRVEIINLDNSIKCINESLLLLIKKKKL